MAKTKKYYVVWKGKQPGIYQSWKACKEQIDNFKGAQYKAFPDLKLAKKAFDGKFEDYKSKPKATTAQQTHKKLKEVNFKSIAVDAASSGNPGKMEYRGVVTKTGKELFKQGPFAQGTNNIGEFLAIVHGLAFLQKNDSNYIIYTDSKTAMAWVRKRKCNTKLTPNAKNAALFDLIKRAETWLQKNNYQNRIIKWNTKTWGEIPADFGRK
ncbi:ribonuclease H1 domain-containing protein [Haloflavibacter putidus]|uniref:Ribonuclease H n=1 Tax=Haloflavibacter putidus TaxID=2576776 RepID=A0A507ZS00_9FLAO|nr:ribonuclease H family protein [Haloflavibacter putidus]TQD40576.1 ribonuclease H [Haloflavibacter putidus]